MRDTINDYDTGGVDDSPCGMLVPSGDETSSKRLSEGGDFSDPGEEEPDPTGGEDDVDSKIMSSSYNTDSPLSAKLDEDSSVQLVMQDDGSSTSSLESSTALGPYGRDDAVSPNGQGESTQAPYDEGGNLSTMGSSGRKINPHAGDKVTTYSEQHLSRSVSEDPTVLASNRDELLSNSQLVLADVESQTKRKNKKRFPRQKQSVLSQFCLGLFSVTLLAIVGGGLTMYFLLFQEWWTSGNAPNNVEPFEDTSTPAPTWPADTPTMPPVAPIFPDIIEATTAPVQPSPSPTLRPTRSPTKSPTKSPTQSPSVPPTLLPTSSPTMPLPTAAPTRNKFLALLWFLTARGIRFSDDPDSPENLAVMWLSQYDDIALNETPPDFDLSVFQRFVVTTLKFSMVPSLAMMPDNIFPTNEPQIPNMGGGDQPPLPSAPPIGARTRNLQEELMNADAMSNWLVAGQHECSWQGIHCVDDLVTEIDFGSLQLEGRIPPQIGFLTNLTKLDISQNAIRGSIPDELYDATNLRQIFMYQNDLEGSISARIGNLDQLTHLHASHNQITGVIPLTMRSTDVIKPYKYINLYSNKMTGTIPANLRWRKLFLLDLGRNQFGGTLPSDLGERFVELRNLHLDHNQFVGTFPETYINAGNGRLTQLTIDHNQLTGFVPSDHEHSNILVSFTLHENLFSEGLDKDTCKQSVFEGGEMVELKVDCEICDCNDIFCDGCNP